MFIKLSDSNTINLSLVRGVSWRETIAAFRTPEGEQVSRFFDEPTHPDFDASVDADTVEPVMAPVATIHFSERHRLRLSVDESVALAAATELS